MSLVEYTRHAEVVSCSTDAGSRSTVGTSVDVGESPRTAVASTAAAAERRRQMRRMSRASSMSVTTVRRLHFTASCTTGWVNYAHEPSQAALERSSQDAYDVIRLTRSKAAVGTVDDVARLIEFFFKFLFIYLFLTSIAYDPEG